MARHVDDFGDAADGIAQHVVGVRKGFVLRHLVTQHLQQFFVQHDDERIDVGFEFDHAGIGVAHAASALEFKRLGHHPHGQDAHFLGHAGDHRGRSGAGAAAHAGGDEEHVRAFDGGADLGLGLHRCFAALVGLAASAQTADAELNHLVRRAAAQGLRVGIGANEFNPADGRANHVFDRVAAAATDADHLDLGALVEHLFFNHFNRHVYLLKFQTG